MYNFNDFKEGKIIINCKTEEQMNTLLKKCASEDIKWRSGKDCVKDTVVSWSRYEEELCFIIVDERLEYSDKEYYETAFSLNIISFDEVEDADKVYDCSALDIFKNPKDIYEGENGCFYYYDINENILKVDLWCTGDFEDSQLTLQTFSSYKFRKIEEKYFTFANAIQQGFTKIKIKHPILDDEILNEIELNEVCNTGLSLDYILARLSYWLDEKQVLKVLQEGKVYKVKDKFIK